MVVHATLISTSWFLVVINLPTNHSITFSSTSATESGVKPHLQPTKIPVSSPFAATKSVRRIKWLLQSQAMPAPSSAHSGSENRVLSWQKDVAKNTAVQVPPHPQSTTRIIINNVTTPAVVVTRAASEPKPEGDISTRAIIGTILGASAGAAVAYAMVKGEHEDREAQRMTYPSIQQPIRKVTETAIIMRPPLTDIRNSQPHRTSTHGGSSARSHYSATGSRVKTVLSPAHSNREPQPAVLRSVSYSPRSHPTSHHSAKSYGTRPPSGSSYSRTSQLSSSSRRETPGSSAGYHHASSAARVPLPESRATTILPEDSISQVSTRRLEDHGRSSHYHSSKSGTSHGHRGHDSHASSRTVKASKGRRETMGGSHG